MNVEEHGSLRNMENKMVPLKKVAARVAARDPQKVTVELAEASLELDTEADNAWTA